MSTATAVRRTDRRMPWDVMGPALTGQAHKSVAAALEANGLDFTVSMEPVYGQAPDGTVIGAPNLRSVVRPMADGSHQVLAVTGKRFTPIQNADAFAVSDHLVAEFGASIVGAADFRGGGASLLVTALPTTITLRTPQGGTDEVNLNLLTKNAHDGSSALTFALTPIRPACTNALPAALREAKRVWKVSHTPKAQERVDLARHAIIASLAYADEFQAEAQAMMDTAMVDREFDLLVARLWKVEEGKEDTRAGQNRLETQEAVRALYRESETLEGVRGTRWGGYNAITEYLDWGREVRTGEVGRAEGMLDGFNTRAKANVWDVFAGAR